MSFTATFYSITDPPNKIDKTLGTAVYTASDCTPFEAVSDLHGSILINWDAAIETANYAVVTGNRNLYCFVKDIVKEIGGRARVILDIDPLTTNAGELKNCNCICETTCKTEKYNRYIANGNLRTTELTIFGMVNQEDIMPLETDHDGIIIGVYSKGYTSNS